MQHALQLWHHASDLSRFIGGTSHTDALKALLGEAIELIKAQQLGRTAEEITSMLVKMRIQAGRDELPGLLFELEQLRLDVRALLILRSTSCVHAARIRAQAAFADLLVEALKAGSAPQALCLALEGHTRRAIQAARHPCVDKGRSIEEFEGSLSNMRDVLQKCLILRTEGVVVLRSHLISKFD